VPEETISAEVRPAPDQARRAALALQQLGFRILHIGATVSVEGPKSLWESTFNVSFEEHKKKTIAGVEESGVTFHRALVDDMRVPSELGELIAEVAFAEPPEFY
jgi:hypothetical protein